jgi:hypothetical protein
LACNELETAYLVDFSLIEETDTISFIIDTAAIYTGTYYWFNFKDSSSHGHFSTDVRFDIINCPEIGDSISYPDSITNNANINLYSDINYDFNVPGCYDYVKKVVDTLEDLSINIKRIEYLSGRRVYIPNQYPPTLLEEKDIVAGRTFDICIKWANRLLTGKINVVKYKYYYYTSDSPQYSL